MGFSVGAFLAFRAEILCPDGMFPDSHCALGSGVPGPHILGKGSSFPMLRCHTARAAACPSKCWWVQTHLAVCPQMLQESWLSTSRPSPLGN